VAVSNVSSSGWAVTNSTLTGAVVACAEAQTGLVASKIGRNQSQLLKETDPGFCANGLSFAVINGILVL
jgi:hypothetical protein